MLVEVETIIPVRNGGPDPIPAGETIEMEIGDALELRDVGAVRILDPDFADERDAPASLLSEFAQDVVDPDLIETLTKERDDARREAGELRELADGATAEILKLKDEANKVAAERDELLGRVAKLTEQANAASVRIAELEKLAPADGQPAANPLPEVSMELTAAKLKEIAAAEHVKLDGKETKADLVAKIRSGRTAQAA